MKRRVPIWSRNGVFYYTDAAGRRVSLRTKDRAAALERYKAQTAKGAAAEKKPRSVRDPPSAPPPPPPPAPPPPPVATSPAAAPGSSPGGGAGAVLPERPDPLHAVGATAAAPPYDGESGEPGGAADGEDDLSPEEIEGAATELAEFMVGTMAQITGAVAAAAHGRVGVVRPQTVERSIKRWLPITRRWAQSWKMGPWTAVTMATLAVMQEQWTCQHGAVDLSGGDAAGAPPPA